MRIAGNSTQDILIVDNYRRRASTYPESIQERSRLRAWCSRRLFKYDVPEWSGKWDRHGQMRTLWREEIGRLRWFCYCCEAYCSGGHKWCGDVSVLCLYEIEQS